MTSLAIHVGFLLLALIPFLTFQVPPPGQMGVLVSFGAQDMGQGDDRPDTQQEEYVEPKPPSESEMAEEQEEVEEEQEVLPAEAQPSEPESQLPEEVVTSDEPDEVAIQKKKEEDAKKIQEELERQEQAEEARKKAEVEAEAKRQADEEARKKAEYDEAKKQFGDAFGGGKGKTDKPGNQGDPAGDPDASRLEGISTGSGMVGGGLGDRGVLFEPTIKDNSQKTGVVVVRVCVDQNGDVVSAKFTQKGSTTADSDLVGIAIKSSERFKFSKSTIDKQCGTITIDFKVR
ncbi:MAG: cell envelope integrity protein TolA [Saprospiraceae bacterium]|nr:cell envelope integrity protein TolA [Saprospiraceae bacterium]